jgi:hypothetical protein
MQALAEDHLNDILSNVGAAITAAVASSVSDHVNKRYLNMQHCNNRMWELFWSCWQ